LERPGQLTYPAVLTSKEGLSGIGKEEDWFLQMLLSTACFLPGGGSARLMTIIMQ
jgi:hypothetical protein